MYFYNKKNRHIFIKIFLVINEKLLPSFALLGMLIKTSYRKTIKEICSRKIDSFYSRSNNILIRECEHEQTP